MKNYDKRVKQTRILLSDYLLLKGFAQRAGVSMSEALHKLIIGLKPEPEPVPVAVATKPAFRVTPPVIALRHRLSPAIATNGSKIPAFRIKHKGVRHVG